MKGLLRLTTIFAVMTFAACSDDTASTNNANNVNNSNNTNNVNNSNNTNNPNNSNNTNNPNNPNNTNNTNNVNNLQDMGEDMSVDMNGETDMEEDMSMASEVPITWPADPAGFASSANANTYISELITPEIQNDVPTCCKDFGAISKNEGTDNALAALDAAISGFGASLAGSLQTAIEDGSVVILLDHRELDSADDADGFVLGWLNGTFDTGTDYTAAAAGSGQFLVTPESFKTASGEPQIVFNPADMIQGNMTAGPTEVSLLLPLDSALLAVTVVDAEVTGIATLSQDGVSYTAGTISGYIELQNLFDALNEFAAAGCGCLGLGNTPLFENDGNGWAGNCVSDAGTLCPGADQEICRVIGGSNFQNGHFCGLLPGVFEGQADIDTDGDASTYEALSLGLEWVGANAEITGIDN